MKPRRLARLRLAEIWLEHLHEPNRAKTLLETSLDENRGDIQAKRYLVEVTISLGQWPDARQLLEELAAEEDPTIQVWALEKLARVAQLGLRDTELRLQCEFEAMRTALPLPHAVHRLVSGYRDRNEQDRLIRISDEVLQEQGDSENGFALRTQVARILVQDMSQPEQALSVLGPVLKDRPDDQDVQLVHANALEQRHQPEEAVRIYRRILQHDPSCADVYEGLARLMGTLGYPESSAAAATIYDLLSRPEVSSRPKAFTSPSTQPTGKVNLQAIPIEADLQPLRRLFEIALPFLQNWVSVETTGEPIATNHPASVTARRMATAVGIGSVDLVLSKEDEPQVHVGSTPCIEVPAALTKMPNDPLFRFWVGRSLALAATPGGATPVTPGRCARRNR